MKEKEEPKIENVKSEDEYIKVSFSPDYKMFNVKGFDENFMNLLKRRIYDISAINPELKVFLDGKKIKVTNFKDYSKLYFEDKFLYKKFDRFELSIGASNEFNHLSFVNSICTTAGGTHLNSVTNQIVKLIHAQFEKLNFHMIKNHFTIFLSSQVENPSFDSQTKDHLNSKVHLDIPLDIVKQIQKSTVIIDNIKEAFNEKEKINAEKKSVRVQKNLGIPKLDDAIWAGGPRSSECTLILTEGDSAKSLAVSGLSVLGREKYGIFPLKGKFLNVRDAPASQINNNEEFQNLKTIIGLHESLKYDQLHKDGKFLLRYGKVILMCDQDFDGSHIKGLIMNMFHHFWPNLLKHDFLQEIITPIVKTWHKNKEYSFFTLEDFESWKKEMGDQKFTSKYYKGLGTSTSKEAIQYFSDLPRHLKSFKYKDKKDDDGIEMAFSKKRVADRKTWLNRSTVPIALKNPYILYQDFINNELILFSRYDNIRSIPSLIDGLKPGQRKVLFACFKRNLDYEIKVAQLSGYVSEVSAYHHGEQSLHSTIINMAQDFVGSNNIPLLTPNGTFGSRLMGGKDAASPRYIFTKLNEITRYIFIKDDDQILEYNYDDGDQIEPKYYVPIIPFILINGSEGIATGWSTFVPTYKPEDVIMNLLNLLKGKAPTEMKMWAKGFNGKIEKEDNKYITYGNAIKKENKRIVVNELPLRKWTEDYKKFLIDSEYKFNEYHTEKTVHFEIRDEIETDDLIEHLKLESSFSLNNMTLFDANGNIKQYKDPNEILKEFYEVRLTYYKKRKDKILENIEQDLVNMKEKLRFLKMIVSGELNISKITKQQIIEKMKALEFKNFDNLLNIAIWNMTADNVNKLENQIQEKEKEHLGLVNKDIKVLWTEDLQLLLKKMKESKVSE